MHHTLVGRLRPHTSKEERKKKEHNFLVLDTIIYITKVKRELGWCDKKKEAKY